MFRKAIEKRGFEKENKQTKNSSQKPTREHVRKNRHPHVQVIAIYTMNAFRTSSRA